jgi:hypothetical protein
MVGLGAAILVLGHFEFGVLAVDKEEMIKRECNLWM